jgi:hypothetical protein
VTPDSEDRCRGYRDLDDPPGDAGPLLFGDQPDKRIELIGAVAQADGDARWLRLIARGTLVISFSGIAVMNATMRVHRPEFGRIETSKLTAGFDMPVLDLELANQPHDLLEVE